jgi:hypothetical protein
LDFVLVFVFVLVLVFVHPDEDEDEDEHEDEDEDEVARSVSGIGPGRPPLRRRGGARRTCVGSARRFDRFTGGVKVLWYYAELAAALRGAATEPGTLAVVDELDVAVAELRSLAEGA